MSEYDVAVIGGSAAGLSAALVLSRARRRVVVLDGQSPRNAPAAHMHGFLSRDGMNPADLLAIGRQEVEGYGGQLIATTVTEVVRDGSAGLFAVLADDRRIEARRVLVATGLRDELPDVTGLRERWARDVLHCPYCHGHEVADRPLGVVGLAQGSAQYAQIVRQWTHDLVYFAAPGLLTDAERSQLEAREIDIVEGDMQQLVVEDDRLVGVRLQDGRYVPREAVFVPPRFVPNDELLRRLGCETDADGWVVTDRTGRTSVPGVWAAGNVTDPRAQVITAAGAGSAAAIAINADLVQDDVSRALQAMAPGYAG